jgi:hypothetical protein
MLEQKETKQTEIGSAAISTKGFVQIDPLANYSRRMKDLREKAVNR